MEAKKVCSYNEILDDIFFDNILTRIPIKNLCRWKLVSKLWCNFIGDPHRPCYKTCLPSIWIHKTPRKEWLPSYPYAEISIYSINNDGVATILQKKTPPLEPFFIKHYNSGLICCYVCHDESLQLTVFDTIIPGSTTVSIPICRTFKSSCFEYGFDPLSKRYKVLNYRHGGTSLTGEVLTGYVSPFNFQVLTLGEESLSWRSIRELSKRIWCLPDRVVIVDGTLFWYGTILYTYTGRTLAQKQIISFNFATEEFKIIELPSPKKYFTNPLFEFEGSLCYVELLDPMLEEEVEFELELKLKVWMLHNNDVFIPMAKNITLSLRGTNLKITSRECFTMIPEYPYKKFYSSLECAEISAQQGELLIVVADDKDQYVFSYSFLSCQCNMIKVIGQHWLPQAA